MKEMAAGVVESDVECGGGADWGRGHKMQSEWPPAQHLPELIKQISGAPAGRDSKPIINHSAPLGATRAHKGFQTIFMTHNLFPLNCSSLLATDKRVDRYNLFLAKVRMLPQSRLRVPSTRPELRLPGRNIGPAAW